ELPHSIEHFFLSGQNDEASLKQWIEKVRPSVVVAVGGDGTVSLVAKQLLGTKIILAILPAGSANGMAKELNIPTNINDALAIILKGEQKCCDVIKINEHLCFHLSDIGLNAKMVKYFAEGNIRGLLGYAKV